jgi:hypothetical protein
MLSPCRLSQRLLPIPSPALQSNVTAASNKIIKIIRSNFLIRDNCKSVPDGKLLILICGRVSIHKNPIRGGSTVPILFQFNRGLALGSRVRSIIELLDNCLEVTKSQKRTTMSNSYEF